MSFREKLISYFFDVKAIDKFNEVQVHDFAVDVSVFEEVKELFRKHYPYISLNENKIIDNKLIDSLGMMGLCSRLCEQFGITVSYNQMTADNFNSIKAIASLVSKLRFDTNLAVESETVFESKTERPLNVSWKEAEKTVVQRVLENSVKEPESIAVIVNGESFTYSTLAKRITGFYRSFKNMGIGCKDKVVVQAICSEKYLSCILALQLAGAVAVPVEKSIGLERIEQIVLETGAKFVFTDCEFKKQCNTWYYFSETEAAVSDDYFITDYPSLDWDEFILFTTGTTGQSKGVVIQNSAVSWLCVSYPHKIGMREHTRNITTYPLNHTSGLYVSLYTLANLGTLILEDGIKSLSSFFDSIDMYKPNKISVPPMVFKMMIMYGYNKCKTIGKDIYNISFGSEAMPADVLERLKEVFPNATLQNVYASTELMFIASTDCRTSDSDVPLGTPFDGVEIALRDENGIISLDRCKSGQICVKSKMRMKEYYNRRELTESVMQDGWTILSDIGYTDENGVLYFRGRADDVITIAGYKISPFEIEENAMKSGLVNECICIKASDDTDVPFLKLLVAGNEKFDRSLLEKFLTDNLESYRVPKVIEQFESVRRNKNGKLDRKSYL